MNKAQIMRQHDNL